MIAKDSVNQIYDLIPLENVRNEYCEMVASVNSAWSLVRDKLKDHGET